MGATEGLNRAYLKAPGPNKTGKKGVRFRLWVVDSRLGQLDNARLVSAEGYSSGQRGQTVNLLAMPT